MNIAKSTAYRFIQATCLAILFLAHGHAAAETAGNAGAEAPQTPRNSIESLDYSTLQSGKTLITLKLKQALKSSPAGFAVNNPPRIALDLPDTANMLGKNVINVGEGILRNLNIVQAGNRTRLVINLDKPAGYETSIEGNNLLITLQSSEAPGGTTSNISAQFAEPMPGTQKHSLRNIDFRRGKDGEGRIVVDISDTGTGIDIRTEGKTVVVDFINTALPRNLERKLDVVDFGTPVQTVSAFSQGNNVRMVIEPNGLWEHSAYQTDRQFILDVKPIVVDSSKLVQGTKTGYSGEKLSLNFQNVEIRAVLEVLAEFTGLNIIASDSVAGNLTLRLKDVPWDQALDIVLQSKGLSMRKSGNVIRIAPTDELAAKEEAELKSRQQISDLEILRTEYYALNYLKADQAKNILMGLAGTASDSSADDAKCSTQAAGVKAAAQQAAAAGTTTGGNPQQILSKRGSASFELKTNMLIINDTPSKHEEIRKLLSVIDVPTKQVAINARIVIADDKFSKQLGARFGVQAGYNRNNYNLGVSGTAGGASSIAFGTKPVAGADNLNVSLPASFSTGSAAGTLGLTLLNLGSGNLMNLELSALEADNRGKVVSNPHVMTSNQRPAVIAQGVQIPVVTPGTSTSPPTTSFKDVLLCLLVNPQILNNDTILLDVEVTKDKTGIQTRDGLAIDTSRVKTQIRLNNGETAVLGGVFEQETRDDVEKVPLLGDIPLVGNLFKHTTKQDDKKELLIFITPKVLKESLNIR